MDGLTFTCNVIELRRSGNLQVSITNSKRMNGRLLARIGTRPRQNARRAGERNCRAGRREAIPLHLEIGDHYEESNVTIETKGGKNV